MRMTPAVKVILILNVVFYILTYWITPLFSLNGNTDWFLKFNSLRPFGFPGFMPHQYLTYMFMHGGWWHLFFNMWSLMIFGNAVEQQVGTKRFVFYYLVCGVGSALIHQACEMLGIISPSYLVGASGAVYGIMAAAAFYFPNVKLFVIPIPFPIKLKYLVGVFMVIEMVMGFLAVDRVGHFAHLGGILVGAIILAIWHLMEKKKKTTSGFRGWDNYSSHSQGDHYEKGESSWKSMFGKKTPKMRVVETRETNHSDHQYNEQKRRNNDEIDRILDKIRKNGYQNLTDSEKATLFDASKKMRGEE